MREAYAAIPRIWAFSLLNIFYINGGLERVRTYDLLIRSQVL